MKVYSDAAVDRRTGIAAYCITIVYGSFKDWSVDFLEGHVTKSNEAEYAGLRAALEIVKRAGKDAEIFCDNMDAIRRITNEGIPAGVIVRYFKAHQLGKDDVVIDDDVKYHHWADTMARAAVKQRILDTRKSAAYNRGEKET